MNLLPSEKPHSSAANQQLSLTNFRVIKLYKARGATNYTSIFLKNISSIRFVSHDYKWLLYIGVAIVALGFLSGFISGSEAYKPIIGGLFFGGIVIGLYFATRKQIIEICGKGSERISTETQQGFDSAYKFICSIEQTMRESSAKTEASAEEPSLTA